MQNKNQQFISTAETLLMELLPQYSNANALDTTQAIKHLGKSVALVAGQLAEWQSQENDIAIQITHLAILDEIKTNLAVMSQFQEQHKTAETQFSQRVVNH